MLAASTAVALLVAGFSGGAGAVLLLLSADRGMVFLDRIYGPPLPGVLKPVDQRR
jgi:hypothetical protein